MPAPEALELLAGLKDQPTSIGLEARARQQMKGEYEKKEEKKAPSEKREV
jgi:hypothetical protein